MHHLQPRPLLKPGNKGWCLFYITMFSVIQYGLTRATFTTTSAKKPVQHPLNLPAQQPKADGPHRASESIMGWFRMAMLGEAQSPGRGGGLRSLETGKDKAGFSMALSGHCRKTGGSGGILCDHTLWAKAPGEASACAM